MVSLENFKRDFRECEDKSSSLQQSISTSKERVGGASVQTSSKMSKTVSKNKMKLKLATEISNSQKNEAKEVKMQKMQTGGRQWEEENSYEIARNLNKEDSREFKVKKKITLPMKVSKALDSHRQPKSQERVANVSSSSKGPSTAPQSFNSVTIMNFKNKMQAQQQQQ